jgi:hypothetical protein
MSSAEKKPFNIFEAVQEHFKDLPSQPKQDAKLLILRQLHDLNRKTLKAAQEAEYSARQAKLAAEAAFTETKVSIEIRKDELGMCKSFTCYTPLDEDGGDYCKECEVSRSNV